MTTKAFLQKLAKGVFGPYQLIRIYYIDLNDPAEKLPTSPQFRELNSQLEIAELGVEEVKTHAWYQGPTAHTFGIVQEGCIVCTCCYWTKDDQRTPTRFFPQIKNNEAVMVDLITASSARGRGYASAVVAYSQWKLKQAGYTRLWTWVWHSNTPSIRTFEKLGWKYSEFLVECEPFRASKKLSFRLPQKRNTSHLVN